MSKTTKAPALKACPWCGNIPNVFMGGRKRWLVQCMEAKCPAVVSVTGRPTRADAIKAWNTRKGER